MPERRQIPSGQARDQHIQSIVHRLSITGEEWHRWHVVCVVVVCHCAAFDLRRGRFVRAQKAMLVHSPQLAGDY